MTVEEMFIQLGFKVDQSSKKKVESDANALKGLLTKALGVIGIGLTLTGVKNFLSECNSIAAEVKATNTQFEQTFKTLDESGNAIADFSAQAKERLNQASQATGVSASRMKASFASLGAFAKTGGMETEQALDFAGRAAEAAADSAAYFDKSIEETMDVMKRLMKGNFTLDDNLGFQSTEATRDAQALEMYGKKYKDLLSWQQQEVILQQIINANMAQGAAGQAKREAGEYTNQVGELSENMKMLKANIGMIGLPIVLSVSQKISAVVQKVADFVGDVNDETSVAAKVQKELLYYMDKIETVISKVVQIGQRMIDTVGGNENAMKLLLAVIAAIAMQQYLPKIISMFTGFRDILHSVNLKAVALIAVIVGIFLIIEDFVGFLNGKDSLFGELLEANGFDQGEVREKILGFFDNVKGKIDEFVEWIKGVPEKVQQFFSDLINNPIVQHVGENFGSIFQSIIDHVQPIIDALQPLFDEFKTLFNVLKGDADKEDLGFVFRFIYEAVSGAVADIGAVLDACAGAFYAVFDGITAAADPFMDYITSMIDGIVKLLTGDWKGALDSFIEAWSLRLEYLGAFFGETFRTAGEMLNGSALGTILTAIGDTIEKIFNWVSELPDKIAALASSLQNLKIDLPEIPSVDDWLGDWKDPEKHPIIGGVYQKMTGQDSDGSDDVVKQAENTGKEVAAAVESSGKQAEQKAESTFGLLPDLSLDWGLHTVTNLSNGMLLGQDPLKQTVNLLAGIVTDNLGHSKPKAGPLKDDDKWGLHMMQNLANGIHSGMGVLGAAVNGAAMLMAAGGQGMMSLAGAGMANAGGYLGGGSSVTVIQNNNFSNQFSGGDRDNQVNAGRQMRRNADDTTAYLANALAYAK